MWETVKLVCLKKTEFVSQGSVNKLHDISGGTLMPTDSKSPKSPKALLVLYPWQPQIYLGAKIQLSLFFPFRTLFWANAPGLLVCNGRRVVFFHENVVITSHKFTILFDETYLMNYICRKYKIIRQNILYSLHLLGMLNSHNARKESRTKSHPG